MFRPDVALFVYAFYSKAGIFFEHIYRAQFVI